MQHTYRILVVSNYTDYHSTRPEASIFLQLQKMGHEIFVMTNAKSAHAIDFETKGISVIDHLAPEKFNKESTALIRETVLKKKIQAVFLFYSEAIINGIRACKDLNVKIILYRGYTGNISSLDPSAYFKYLNPRVDAVVCNSSSIEDLLKKQFSFKKQKAFTINKGHDLKWYVNVEKGDLTEFGIEKNAFVATCMANARRMKGIKYLIKASYFIPIDKPIYLLFIGNGLETNYIKKLLEKSPIKHKIIFTGFRKDALSLVKSSDIFVLPSIKGESITKSVMEAMSMGIATLITNISGNRELVIDNKCGLVVPKKDPKSLAKGIIKYFENPELIERFGKAAQNQIDSNFNTKQTALGYQKMLDTLLSDA